MLDEDLTKYKDIAKMHCPFEKLDHIVSANGKMAAMFYSFECHGHYLMGSRLF
jgi:transposase-like protein